MKSTWHAFENIKMPTIPVDIGPVPACIVQAASDYAVPARALLAIKAALLLPGQPLRAGLASDTPFPVHATWLSEFARTTGLKIESLKSNVCWTARATAYVLRYEINRARGDFWEGVGRFAASKPPRHSKQTADVSSLIEDASRRAGLDPLLVEAVVQVESGYRWDARSPKGALGLMQLMPGTAALYGVRTQAELLTPAINVETGIRHLLDLWQTFRGDLQLTLAAYNAGAEAVNKAGLKVPPYPETQRYVHAVTTLYGPTFRQRVYEISQLF